MKELEKQKRVEAVVTGVLIAVVIGGGLFLVGYFIFLAVAFMSWGSNK